MLGELLGQFEYLYGLVVETGGGVQWMRGLVYY